ncbi:MAG: Fic family protein [Candidatus Paceibacterota bacterium]
MKKGRIIPTTSTNLRHKWLEKLGGIKNVSVRNKEWLILLQEDTRNSLMIEGHFVTRADLADVIENSKYSKHEHKILGYFDAAVASYELAFQQYKNKEFKITKSIIQQAHSLMFRGDPNFSWTPGEWRKGDIKITGAEIATSSPFKIERDIENLIKIINTPEKNLVRKVAVVHDVFEQIHPFPDGNGRVGRILLNFILVGHGYPNIAIKGFGKDLKLYIDALEEGDSVVGKLLSKSGKVNPFTKPLIQLEDLISKSIAIALDVIICTRYNEIKKLMTLEEISKTLNISLSSLRVACAQKKHICSKIDGKIKTHPDLFYLPE